MSSSRGPGDLRVFFGAMRRVKTVFRWNTEGVAALLALDACVPGPFDAAGFLFQEEGQVLPVYYRKYFSFTQCQ